MNHLHITKQPCLSNACVRQAKIRTYAYTVRTYVHTYVHIILYSTYVRMYICDLHTSLSPHYRAAGLPMIKCWLWVQNDTGEETIVQAHLILRINHQWPTSSPGNQHSILCGHLEERAGGAYAVHIHVHICTYIRMYVCTYNYICTYTYVCMYIYIRMYVKFDQGHCQRWSALV